MPKSKDITGERYGKLVVTKMLGLNRRHKRLVQTDCDCGVTEHVVLANSLRSGTTKSCGCAKIIAVRKRCTTHGMKTRANPAPEYAIWVALIARCHDPSAPAYPNYGGRGIAVCARWRASFVDFISDVGRRPEPHLTIERIDNAKGYEPGNCTWTTRSAQMNNTRLTTFVEYRGERVALTVLCRRLGVDVANVRWRLKNRWSIEDAVREPTRRGGRPFMQADAGE